MLIRTDGHTSIKRPQSRSADSRQTFAKPQAEASPPWVDALVPSVPVVRNTAVSMATGTAAGLGVGYLLGNLALGGAVGAAAGVAGSLAVHAYQSSQRQERKEEVVAEHDLQRAQLQEKLGVPSEASGSFERATAYSNGQNLLVEFAATGSFLSVTNTGPKRPVLWVSEGQARGAFGETVGRANRDIPETRMELASPLRDSWSLHGGSEVARYSPLGAKDQQVELSDDGKLSFAHSGRLKGAGVYDLNNGDVDSPFLKLRGGVVQDLELSSQRYGRQDVGYSYRNGAFVQVGGDDASLRPTLPLKLLGNPISFPPVDGANQSLTRTKVAIHNQGVFASAELKETVTANYVPKGADWVPNPEDRLESESLSVHLKGGGTIEQSAHYDGGRSPKEVRLSLNGQRTHGLTASATPEAITIHKPRTDPMRATEESYTQTIGIDGTITWKTDNSNIWNEYTFRPDGTVTGEWGSRGSQPVTISQEELPSLEAGGTINFAGYQQQLFLAPEKIGR